MPSPRARKINNKYFKTKLCVLLKLNKQQPIKPESDQDSKPYYQLMGNTREKGTVLKTAVKTWEALNNLVSSITKLQGQWWGVRGS